MPRLDVPIGPNGPIVDIRLSVGPEDAKTPAAARRPGTQPFSVAGLVDTGAEMTAIETSLARSMGIPVFSFLQARSSLAR
jgi:hypothetical protein